MQQTPWPGCQSACSVTCTGDILPSTRQAVSGNTDSSHIRAYLARSDRGNGHFPLAFSLLSMNSTVLAFPHLHELFVDMLHGQFQHFRLVHARDEVVVPGRAGARPAQLTRDEVTDLLDA